MAVDPERTRKMLEALVAPEFHRWYNPEAEHLFVIGHENGHSLGPGSEFQTALGAYAHIIEENKADVISITFMPEYVKTGIISEATLKEIYVTWIVRLLLKSRPQLIQPHRVGDLIHFNFLRQNGVILFNADRKLEIDFTFAEPTTKVPRVKDKEDSPTGLWKMAFSAAITSIEFLTFLPFLTN